MENGITPSIFATEWAPGNLQSEKYRLSLDGIFQKVKQLGSDYVHLVYRWNFTKDDVPHIQALIKKYDVHVSCVHSLTRLNHPSTQDAVEKERDQLSDAIEIAQAFDARLVACNFGENADRDEDAAIAACKRHYAACFKAAADAGITIVVENTCSASVGGEITTSTEGMMRLLEGVGSTSFKSHFDPGNLQSMGEEAYPYAYELLKEHIRLIHLKDVVQYNSSMSHHRRSESAAKLIGTAATRYVTVPVGQGEVNVDGLLQSLVADGYQGFVDIEPHTVEERLDEFYAEGLRFLSRHLS